MHWLYGLKFIHNYLLMERQLAILTKLTKMPERDLTPILGLFESIDVPAKKVLLAPGTICPEVWVVGSGSIRAYYTLEASQFFTLSRQNYETLLSTRHEVGWKYLNTSRSWPSNG